MYLVDPDVLKSFLDKNNLASGVIPKPEGLPCIIEFNSQGVLKAKIEVSNFDEFLAVVKFGKDITEKPKNKYWIRGNEWRKDENGNFIKELSV